MTTATRIPTQTEYEAREARLYAQQIRDIETAPLADRKEAAKEWANYLANKPALIAERISWLLNGSYGFWSYKVSREIAANKRLNRTAGLARIIAALEWETPHTMAARAFRALSTEQQAVINSLIQAEIDYYLASEAAELQD